MSAIVAPFVENEGDATMKTFKATVRMNGRAVEVQVQARTAADARSMLEAQYGKPAILYGPHEVF